MASELKVDTISEKTTASGVTIDGVLIKDGEVDGVDVSGITSNTAFDEIDIWVINTDLTADHIPIIDTYFTRHSGTLINMPKGTGVSVNGSGNWTFPKTGYYEIKFIANVENDTNSNATEIYIYGSNDNCVTNDRIAFARYYGNDNSRTTYQAYAIVDITDVSNDKVRFALNEVNTSTLRGGTSEFISGVIFKRLGDT